MNWISRLERKFGRYAIPNLMYFIIILYGIGFVLDYINPYFYIQYLSLNAAEILHGQIWRIVTFLIQSPSNNLIFLIIALYFYYMIGRTLEQTWGSFRFNLYFFTGVLFHVIAALLIYLVTGQVYMLGTSYLNLSRFFAFAAFSIPSAAMYGCAIPVGQEVTARILACVPSVDPVSASLSSISFYSLSALSIISINSSTNDALRRDSVNSSSIIITESLLSTSR